MHSEMFHSATSIYILRRQAVERMVFFIKRVLESHSQNEDVKMNFASSDFAVFGNNRGVSNSITSSKGGFKWEASWVRNLSGHFG